MNAMIVYESMFGNTRDIAEAIAAGIAESADVQAIEVGEAPDTIPEDVDLLVVGGPTHQFGMSRPSSREMAGNEAPEGLVSPGIGLREWLAGLPLDDRRRTSATFATVVESPRFVRYFGNAGSKAAKRLKKLGYRQLDSPGLFWVTGTKGPLVNGELARARDWGRQLAVATHAQVTPVPAA